ncbi:MAG: heme anaerobic degradation radical SAM methyltransferase ChuW/HutW [Pseudomonadota bacterium]
MQLVSAMERPEPREGKLGLLEAFLAQAGRRPVLAREGVDPLPHAFSRKSAVHPGLGGRPLRDQDGRQRLEALLQQPPGPGLAAAYFHIPFCASRCLYCGFFGQPLAPGQSRAYTDALLREMSLLGPDTRAVTQPLQAVYLGGGTPSALEAGDLARLLEAVREWLPLTNDCEITVEGRVYGFDRAKVRACLEAGANRFSIGVQSFDTDLRRSLGRRADRAEVLDFLGALAADGRAVVVIDLIYGLPGQDMAAWEADLATLTDLAIDGADLYQLNRFPGGLLDKAVLEGRVAEPADLARQSALFARGVDLMQRARWRRLSICHWGRTSRERNLYNLLIKRKAECLAFGAGGGGSRAGHFYFLDGDPERYLAAVGGGVKPVVMCLEPPDQAEVVAELGGELELGRVDLTRLGRAHGLDLNAILAPLLEQWERVGLIERRQGWVELTLAGQFWQVNLTQALIDYLDWCGKQTGPAAG